MKKGINLLIAILISTLSIPVLQAQDIDRDRMNRDLNIMENILQELFKTRWEAHGNTAGVSSGSFFFGNDHPSGTYLQDYGVVFTVSGGVPAFVLSSNTEGDASGFYFRYGNDKEDNKKVTEESIINRMKEFFRYYSPNIGQLDDDDKITVIYENNRSDRPAFISVLSSSGEKKDKTAEPELPSTIYATVTRADLEAVKNGSISESEFNNRLIIKTIEEENKKRDLKIMANILKTTFEVTESDAFKIRGDVNNIYIEDLGALFYLDTSYGSGFYTFGEAIVAARKKLSEIVDTDSNTFKFYGPTNNDKTKSERKEERTRAYQQFLEQLRETIVDYGRTLKSVQSDEHVYVSVSLSSSGDELPDRVNLQIKKSALEAVDRGNMSREEAINQIKDKEYYWFSGGRQSSKLPHVPVHQ